MIESSPISIPWTRSICVCDVDHPMRSIGIGLETRDNFDESISSQIETSLDSRRGPVASINRDTMMLPQTTLGVQTLHVRMTLADDQVSNIMPTNGTFPGGNNYESTNRNKEKNKPNM
jgi:hypothetical protein